MSAQRRQDAAASLRASYAAGPIEPLTASWPEMTIEDAYAVQRVQIAHRVAAGDAIKGHKVGLTSIAMQRQLGVDAPDYGHLLASMFCADGDRIPVGRFLQPRVEPEVAFVLREPLAGPGVTAAQAVRAVDFVLPALEIIDSRIADWRITLLDTIADNASCGAVVLGSRPVRLSAVDLRLAGCSLHVGGALVATGAGGAVLGSPLNALVWLANALGEFGVTLQSGEVVLPGSMTPAQPVSAGQTVSATFAAIGSVTAHFSGSVEEGIS